MRRNEHTDSEDTMKRMMVVLLVVVPALVGSLSCNKNETVIDGGGGCINCPTYTSLTNSFTYFIIAQGLTSSDTIPASFTKNRLLIGAALHSSEGSATFVLLDERNNVLRTDTFQRSGVYQILSVVGLPRAVAVSFRQFTGTLNYWVVGDSLIGGFPISLFPNTEGSQWVYAWYDSILRRRDTVTVSALNLVTLPGNIDARIWQRRWSSGATDTQYVWIRDDTLRMFSHPGDPYYGRKFVFPLYLGKQWTGDFLRDTSKVTSIQTLPVPAGSFTTHLVEQSWFGPNDYGHIMTWVAPNVGIVMLRRKEMWNFADEEWHLLRYIIR
jgi:hypothetical protein